MGSGATLIHMGCMVMSVHEMAELLQLGVGYGEALMRTV